MIWQVTLDAPAINEIVTTEADSEAQAIERAVASALARQLSAGTAVARAVPVGAGMPQSPGSV